MLLKEIHAKKILDSRGEPTIEKAKEIGLVNEGEDEGLEEPISEAKEE